MNPWELLLDGIANGLDVLHRTLEPLVGIHAWGWAIIALTVVIRLLLLPLAIKQTRSMRAMQSLQPKIKRIQQRHKADRDLLKRDPQKYRERKAKMNEEVMALYKEHHVNPAAGCLPLILQAPIFFALFRVLNDQELVLSGDAVAQQPFYVFSPLGEAAKADAWGWLLIVLMALTMFVTQRQMTGRSTAEGPQAQQQKILMYVMPVFLALIAQSLPLGVLLYWVTTNLWQLAQQGIIKYEVQHHPGGPDSDGARPAASRPSSDGERRSTRGGKAARPRPTGDRSRPGSTPRGASDHLPRRRGTGGRRAT